MDFDLKKFISDTQSVLIAPRAYFTAMDKTGGYLEPVIRAGIYGIISGVFHLIWSLLFPPAVQSLGGGAAPAGVGVSALVMPIITVLVGLFVVSIIILVLSAICGGSTNVEAGIRCAAALTAIAPIHALLGFAAGIHPVAGATVSFVVTLYAVWLMYNALIHALGGTEKSTRIASCIVAAIPAIVFVVMVVGAVKSKGAIEKLTGDRQQREESERTEREALEFINRLKEMQRQQKGE